MVREEGTYNLPEGGERTSSVVHWSVASLRQVFNRLKWMDPRLRRAETHELMGPGDARFPPGSLTNRERSETVEM